MRTTMQKVVLWLTVAAVLGLGIGGVIIAGTSHSGNVRLSEQPVDVTRSLAGATAIEVSAIDARIFVHESATGAISAHLHGRVNGIRDNLPSLEAEVRDGVAYIKVHYPRHVNLSWFTFSDDLALDVYVPKTAFKQARINAGSGDISIDALQSDDLTVKTISGKIQARSLAGGRILAETASGRIVIESVRANEFSAKSVSGSIRVNQIEAVRGSAETASGNVILDRFSGGLDARSISGDIEVTFAKLAADVRAKNTSGHIMLVLPADASFKLDAGSVSGEVHCSFPVTSTDAHSGKELNGTVAGGSHLLSARSISGEIEIEQQ